jgi:predicted aminopeptidase
VRLLRAAGLLLLVALLLSGCYLAKQGYYLVSYSLKAEDIEKVLARKDTPAGVRKLLDLVLDVRRFGVEQIGLKENRNYTTYVSIDKDYLVDVVSACADDSFTRHTWWFPFFGSFPYKGFYERKDAERLARRLERRHLDVLVRHVDAFSTLGFFRDPVYSFMERYPVFELASVILHEQTHATLFLKNQVQFNEGLATFVGTQGALLYLKSRYGEQSELYKRTLLELQDDEEFTAFLKQIYAALQAVYSSDRDREAKLAAKAEILADYRNRFVRDYAKLFRTDRYRSFAKARVNNAYLDLYATYTQDLSVFEDLYGASGGDLRRMMERLEAVKDFGSDAKGYIRDHMLGGAAEQADPGAPASAR